MTHPRNHRWRRGLIASLAVTAVGVAGLPAVAHADWSGTETVSENPADDPTVGYRRSGNVVIAPDGATWFGWVATDDATGTTASASVATIYVARKPAGGTWQRPTVVATVNRPAGSSYPSVDSVRIAVDGAGRPTVAWSVVSGGPAAPTSLRVSTASLGSDGTTWSAVTSFDQDTLTVSSLDKPLALDVNPDGQAALAWQTNNGVHLVHRAPAGTWSAEVSPETITDAQVVDTVGLGLDQEGRATIAWRSYDATDKKWDVKVRTQNSTGTSWAGDAVTLAKDVTLASRVSLAVDTSGAAVATWGSSDGARAAVRTTGAAVDVWSTPHSLSSGAANAVLAPPAKASALTTAGTAVPSATFDPYGTAYVIWPDKTDAPAVKLTTVSPAGTWSDASVVATGSADYPPLAPKIAVGRDGAATATWVRQINQAKSPVGGEVQVANRPSATAAWSEPATYVEPENGAAGTASTLGLTTFASSSLSGDLLGDAVVSWTPYYPALLTGAQQQTAVSFTADRSTGLEWTARGVGGSSNIRSWLGYLRTDWAGSAACPQGAHGVEVSDGASLPSSTDDESWRFTQTEAYRDATGKAIVQYHGTLRWALEAHCIDIKITNPRLEIAADGTSARLYADGETSGSMADAQSGNATQVPFSNRRILDLDLSHAGPRTAAGTQAWASAPATLNAAFASYAGLTQYGGNAFGFLTVVAPSEIRQTVTPAPVGQPANPPAPSVKLTPAQQKVANAQAKVTKTTTAIKQVKAAAKAAKKAHKKAQAKKLAKKIATLKKTLTKQKKALAKAKAAAKKASKKKH